MNTKTMLSAVALTMLTATAVHAQEDERWRQLLKTDEVTWYADMTTRQTKSVTNMGSRISWCTACSGTSSSGSRPSPLPHMRAFEEVTVRVVWVKQVYAKPQTIRGKRYQTMFTQYLVDCQTYRWAQGQWVARTSDGSVVDSGDDSRGAVRMEDVVPESVGEEAMKGICKL